MICVNVCALLLDKTVLKPQFFQLSQTPIQLLVQQPTLWPVGYELVHMSFKLKYFNPLGILHIHCGLFGLHKFCCLALFFFPETTHTCTNTLLVPFCLLS